MKKFQLGSSIFLLIFGILFCVEARKLPMGRITKPGPGFFPFWLAVSMVMVSLALIISGGRKDVKGSLAYKGLWEGLKWEKAFFTLVALLLYAFFLEWLGYCIATFVLIFYLFSAIGGLRWWAGVIGSILTSLLTYMLFRLWLEVQLPKGLWGM
jgi:putative tricarboxylic transport membrane protein